MRSIASAKYVSSRASARRTKDTCGGGAVEKKGPADTTFTPAVRKSLRDLSESKPRPPETQANAPATGSFADHPGGRPDDRWRRFARHFARPASRYAARASW